MAKKKKKETEASKTSDGSPNQQKQIFEYTTETKRTRRIQVPECFVRLLEKLRRQV